MYGGCDLRERNRQRKLRGLGERLGDRKGQKIGIRVSEEEGFGNLWQLFFGGFKQ